MNKVTNMPGSQPSTTPAPSRGRPKSPAKKKQIFQAAVKLFLDRGFEGTSMDEVAEHAGVSKQTVYSHFNSKEDLFSYCITHKCTSYQLSAEFLDHARPLDEMLRKIAHKFARMLVSSEVIRVKRLLCAMAEQSTVLASLYYEAGPKHMMDMLAAYLAEQARRGRLELADPRVAACQFLFMLQGEAHQLALINLEPEPDLESLDHYVEACVDTFLRAHRAIPEA